MPADHRPVWAKTVAEHIAEAQADEVLAEIAELIDQPQK